MPTDGQYMQRALALAERGRGRTSPNPMVGCVVVRHDTIVGEGYHSRAGNAHAEVAAIEDAGGDIAGATLYLTLEPCTFHGRTPPCAGLLVEKKPARVVVAMLDPNPRVNGAGVEQLRAAGIQVDVGVCGKEAERLNEVFIKYIRTGRPFVIAKCGMTLDGKIATRTGHSQWVTSAEARRMVHELRDVVDGILVGSRTVMMDNPSLTTRLGKENSHDPVRIILDAEEYLAADRVVFQVESKSPTWVAGTTGRTYEYAAQTIRVPRGKEGVDIAALMHELGKREITSLLIEGGGTTLASSFEAGIVDKVCFFIAPKIIGGRDAVTAVEGEGVASMDQAIQVEDMTVTRVGPDLLVEGYVKHAPGAQDT